MSILDDIDVQIEQQDVTIINNTLNRSDSPINKLFRGATLQYEIRDGRHVFSINDYDSFMGLNIMPDTISKVKSEIYDDIHEFNSNNRLTILADDLSADIASKIQCPYMVVRANTYNGVELSTVHSSKYRYKPMIYLYFTGDDAKMTDCKMEIDYSHAIGSLSIYDAIPQFDNVSSESIMSFNVLKSSESKNSNRIAKDNKWNNLFEFGYKAEYSLDGNTAKKNILGMKSLAGIVKDRNFQKMYFREYPYRLKKGAKMTDFIDVSKFDVLNEIKIECDGMGVMIFKKESAEYMVSTLFNWMIRPTVGEMSTMTNIINSLPCTDDGWSVLLCEI